MKCDDIVEVILCGGALSDEAQAHIARCDECRALQDSVETLESMGDADRQRDLSEFSIAATLHAAGEIQRARTSPPHTKLAEWRLLRPLASAAAIVLILGAGVIVVQKFLSQEEPAVGAVTGFAYDSSMHDGLDERRTELRYVVASFPARYDSSHGSGIDADMAHLRARLTMATIGIERELAGIR